MQQLQKAILKRDVDFITEYFFEKDFSLKDTRKNETELWDYKESLPDVGKKHDLAWARVAKYVLSFYNKKGGLLLFGIKNNYTVIRTSSRVDSRLFNDKIRKFIPDSIYVDFINYNRNSDGKYIGIAIIPPRGAVLEKFTRDSPLNPENGEYIFKKGWSAIRWEDTCRILSIDEVIRIQSSNNYISNYYGINEPMFKIFKPDYKKFIYRETPCREIEKGLYDKRTSITSITGIGGIGKTALATWAVLKAYEEKKFSFIISITAKDRELAPQGILSIKPNMTTFESLLDLILDVFEFYEEKKMPLKEKEGIIRDILERSNGLIFVDNLETIEDEKIIQFLDTLPYGMKAIVTSRRNRVKFSAYPITIERMSSKEVEKYINSLSEEEGTLYLSKLNKDDISKIAKNIDGIPLAIKWCARRSSSSLEFISITEDIKNSGRSGEELLEFSYRRIFDTMTNTEKNILYSLACFNRALESEAIYIACKPYSDAEDKLEDLIEDALVARNFNPEKSIYEYSLMPLTRNFIFEQLKINKDDEKAIRERLSNYYEAKDILDTDERELVKQARTGGTSSSKIFEELGLMAYKQNDFNNAEDYFKKSIGKNKINVISYWKLGEIYRHYKNDIATAVKFYSQANSYINKNFQDYPVFYREYGLLVLSTKDKNCKKEAEEYFRKALEHSYDSISLNKLVQLLNEKQQYTLVIDLYNKFKEHLTGIDKQYIYPELMIAYKKSNMLLEYSFINNEIKKYNSIK